MCFMHCQQQARYVQNSYTLSNLISINFCYRNLEVAECYRKEMTLKSTLKKKHFMRQMLLTRWNMSGSMLIFSASSFFSGVYSSG